MTKRPALAWLAAVLLMCTVAEAQQPQRSCEVSSLEVSAARRLPQVVGEINLMVRGLQAARIEAPDKDQACTLQKRIDSKRAEETKNFEQLGDDCTVENMKVGEIKRRINSPVIHREDECN
jgi:hypothetical protein